MAQRVKEPWTGCGDVLLVRREGAVPEQRGHLGHREDEHEVEEQLRPAHPLALGPSTSDGCEMRRLRPYPAGAGSGFSNQWCAYASSLNGSTSA